MADCYQFAPGSRQRQICDGESELPLRRVNAFRAMYGVEPLAVEGEVKIDAAVGGGQAVSRMTVNHQASRVAGGCCGGGRGEPVQALAPSVGPGTELISILKGVGFAGCDDCYKLAKRMDEWGESCTDHLDEIIEDMLPRMVIWEKSKVGWLAKLIPAGANKVTLSTLVTTAIEQSKKKKG